MARYLVRAVMNSVMTAGFGMMLFGVAGMTMRAVGVVRRLLVIAGFVMLGGLVMVVLDACVVAHIRSPGWQCENATPVYAGRLTLC
jgi:hypothetical protein